MNEQLLINIYMALGMSKADATKRAQQDIQAQQGNATGAGSILFSGPTTQTKTVGRPGSPGTISTVIPGKSVSTDKAIAMIYGDGEDSKKLRTQLQTALSSLGYGNLTMTQMASTWENLVKQTAAQNAAGYQQTPWDLLPMMIQQNPAAQTVQQYTTNYFTAKGKPNAAANVLLRETLAKVLGHVPSEEEIGQYRPLLDEMQKQQKAGLFTTSVNNKTGVTTPGIDPKQWLAEQISSKHQARVQYGKETAPVSTQNSYVRLAQDYGYNPYNPDGTLSEAARLVLSKIEGGKMSLEDAQEQLKQAALAKYAYLKPQFDAGLTLRQIADPAISAVANILEKDPNTITVNDPSIQKYLYGKDGKGTMPMYEYESTLRQDPSWQFTKNARAQFADLAAFIGNKFGMNV